MADPSHHRLFSAGASSDNGSFIFVRVCEEREVSSGTYRCFEVGGKSILLCNVAGNWQAIINSCTHLRVPLVGGRMIGNTLTCPMHGARFDIPTGKVLCGPAVRSLTTYPVKSADGAVYVRLPTQTNTDS